MEVSVVVQQPMSPKSPPGGLDLYGKRRQWVKLQVLEREIALLQEELKSIDGLQPASRSCKELDSVVGAKPDPFIVATQEIQKSKLICNTLWGKLCSKLGRIYCCFGCSQCQVKMCNCCTCCVQCNPKCCCCCCCCCSYSFTHCCCCSSEKTTCQSCCKSTKMSCLDCRCCCFKSPCGKCTEVNCAKCCYKPCCL